MKSHDENATTSYSESAQQDYKIVYTRGYNLHVPPGTPGYASPGMADMDQVWYPYEQWQRRHLLPKVGTAGLQKVCILGDTIRMYPRAMYPEIPRRYPVTPGSTQISTRVVVPYNEP